MARLETWLVSLSAGGTATIFAAPGAGIRWKLIYAHMTVKTTAGGATASISFYEAGTATTLVFGNVLATQNVAWTIDIAQAGGMAAASTNTRLSIANGDSGPMYGLFIGETW